MISLTSNACKFQLVDHCVFYQKHRVICFSMYPIVHLYQPFFWNTWVFFYPKSTLKIVLSFIEAEYSANLAGRFGSVHGRAGPSLSWQSAWSSDREFSFKLSPFMFTITRHAWHATHKICSRGWLWKTNQACILSDSPYLDYENKMKETVTLR